MNLQLPVRMDKAAFLDWVQGREERYELDRGRVIMMTGGSRAHWQITANLFKALDARIDPQRWAVLPEFGVDLQAESKRPSPLEHVPPRLNHGGATNAAGSLSPWGRGMG